MWWTSVCSVLVSVSITLLSWFGGADAVDRIVTGEHFDDLVGTTNRTYTAAKDTVLVIHGPQCTPKLDASTLPSVAYLFYLEHDPEELRYVWYELSARDHLKDRYSRIGGDCLQAVFFRQGSSLDDRPQRWQQSTDSRMLDWIWQRVQVTLVIRNHLADTIVIRTTQSSTAGPTVQDETIQADQAVQMESYLGYIIDVYMQHPETFLMRVLINKDDIDIGIKPFMKTTTIDGVLREQDAQAEWATAQLRSHYGRYMMLIKQPLLVHNYTATGYERMRMPDEVYKYVKDFYDSGYEAKRDEQIEKNEQLCINKNEIRPNMIDLTERTNHRIAQDIQGILEKWCNCRLRFNIGYGIREYYAGNVLYNHVDKVATHVISVIIQVDQEISDNDWMLEVIGYDGQRQEVKLLPGEMLLYESAKLIHGRPKPFGGRRFANCFFHFSPVRGWPFDMIGSDLVNTQTGQKESLWTIRSDFIKDRHMFVKDEL